MVAELGGLIVMGVSDSSWWVAVVLGLTTTAITGAIHCRPPPPPPPCIIVGGGSGGLIVMSVSGSRWWVAVVPGLTSNPTKEKKSCSKMAYNGLKWILKA